MTTSALEFLPARKSLSALAEAAEHCRGCDLYLQATQSVFGEGLKSSRLVMIGEQPGDEEDRQGKPFVGPAGRVLDEALEEAGIDRLDVYVTNAVKHFKWEPRGKRRLHKKPSAREVQACHPWLQSELEAIEPEGIVCLGAVAARALLGRSFRITTDRGRDFPSETGHSFILATWHPSAILRCPEPEQRHRMRVELVTDLKRAASLLR